MCEKIRISVFCFISQYSSCCLSSGNGPGVIRKQSFGAFRVPLISQECVVIVATVIFFLFLFLVEWKLWYFCLMSLEQSFCRWLSNLQFAVIGSWKLKTYWIIQVASNDVQPFNNIFVWSTLNMHFKKLHLCLTHSLSDFIFLSAFLAQRIKWQYPAHWCFIFSVHIFNLWVNRERQDFLPKCISCSVACTEDFANMILCQRVSNCLYLWQ